MVDKNIRIKSILSNIERTFLPIGSQLGKYKILEEIDRGGMAVVYKALQLDLEREVALKVMPANITINPKFVERFLSEAHAVAKLSHPNIVNIHEVAMENNIYYLAMDYIPGKNLYYYLYYNKPKLVEVLEIVSKLADALQYAHEQKIIHRDLKLNNVIMKDNTTPVLIDFGLAKALEPEDAKSGITRTGEIMGSPAYMAPERLLGGVVDHRSDICSLGIMLYEMLTFKNPYLDQRNLHQTTINVMEANPIPPRKLVPWLPPEIEAITLKAMAKSPSDRYQSMAEFRDDIIRYQKGEPVRARPMSIWIKAKHFTKKNWAPLVIGGLITLFLIITGISIYFQKKKGQSHWQLVYSENFESVNNLDEWVLSQDKDGNKIWEIKEGSLRCKPTGLAYARLNRRFNRDIRIECDIIGDSLDIYNCGIYLFADHPDSGYVFHLNANGKGNYGISFPESKFIFLDVYPSSIPFGNVNHIVIEKVQNSITYSINGLVVSKIWDFMPPLGKEHEHFGLFTNNCSIKFDNLKIYRRAIPEAPRPTLIADRFAEKGDFEGAIEEYRGLLLDFANSEIISEIYLKMAECFIRLDRLDEAANIIDNKISTKNRDDTFKAQLLLLKSIIQSKKGNIKTADSLLQVIALKYSTNPVNIYGMIKIILQCSKAIEEGRLGDAYREMELMDNSYKKISSQWGKLYLYLLESYIKSKSYDSALIVIQKIKKGFSANDYLVSLAKIGEGRIFLNKGQKDKAKDVFDRCLASHVTSDSKWEVWKWLAEIYEYENRFKEAATIYKKIYEEASPFLVLRWIAAINFADIAGKEQPSRRDSLLNIVVNSNHPFPIPRLIGKYYLGLISEEEFKEKWNMFYPQDNSYLFFLVNNAIFRKEHNKVKLYLTELKKKTPKNEWNYFRTLRMYNNMFK